MMPLFQGRLYWRGDDGYELERVGRVFNGRKPDRYPAAILKAECEEDVVAGVRLALERGLKISVRSGGHSWAAWSVRDDSLLIDMAGLREISLDTNIGIVRVSPAVTGDALNGVLAKNGFMFNGGHCPGVGLECFDEVIRWAHEMQEAIEALAPLGTCPVIDKALVKDVACPTTLANEYEEQRRENPEGYRYAVDNAWISAGADQSVPALRDAFATLPTKESFSIWFGMAPLRELPDMALSLQADLYFATYVIWKDEADDESSRAWLAEQMRRIEPVSDGLFLADADFTRRSAKFIFDAHWERLEKLRVRYDPNGLFHAYLAEPGTQINVNSWKTM